MARLESNGFPVTTLTEQNRAVPGISVAYDNAFYHSSLVDGPQTNIEARHLAKELLMEFNERADKKKSPVIYLDVQNGDGQKTGANGSIFNEENLVVGTDLVYNLMRNT
ncbi:hypothetical protein GJ744_003693 [Endocarpon pusillum]|uniref:DNA2/NAM7 helicase-like C-terminal domain-containing protein n=1 Tax=Endocarpon pusillum TaxID=364733 RepID=A0A8H7DZ85_9EURO|nr:hypothetical protein GJ744_003693 [Endocarpon pusillum]